jgi:hypothetical protein
LIDDAAGVYRWLLALLTSLKGGIGRTKKLQLASLKGMTGQVIKHLPLKDKA